MFHLRSDLSPAALAPKLRRLFDLSAAKIRSIEKSWEPARGAPVFTVGGQYTSRGWTEWTQGFQFGSAILQFDATGDAEFLEIGRQRTVDLMAPHLSHTAVHDHGFNNVSTYGNLLRLMSEGRIAENLWERRFYQVALKVSGAVQAARWSRAARGGGGAHHLLPPPPALALRGPHPPPPRPRRQPPAGARAHGGERSPDLPHRPCRPARPRHRQVCRLVRRRPRRLRRARPHRARKHLQRQRWQLPLPQFAAGLLALQYLDARARLGHVRLRRATGTLRHPAGARRDHCHHGKGRLRHLRFLPRAHPSGWHSLLGYRGARPRPSGRLARHPGRSLQPVRTGGQFRRRHRRARSAPPRPPPPGRSLFQRRPEGVRYPLHRTLFEYRRQPPGPDPPLRVSPPQRMGRHPGQRQDSGWGVLHVARLSRSRGGPLSAAVDRGKTLSEVLVAQPRHA